jgi:hypothetical protein
MCSFENKQRKDLSVVKLANSLCFNITPPTWMVHWNRTYRAPFILYMDASQRRVDNFLLRSHKPQEKNHIQLALWSSEPIWTLLRERTIAIPARNLNPVVKFLAFSLHCLSQFEQAGQLLMTRESSGALP